MKAVLRTVTGLGESKKSEQNNDNKGEKGSIASVHWTRNENECNA